MSRSEAKVFLESQREAKKEMMQRIQDALDDFDDWDEIGVYLLGPKTERGCEKP